MAELEIAEACLINIGPRERRKRLVSGVVTLALTGGLAAYQLVAGVGRSWRLALFVPLWAAGLGFFQAFDKT